MFELTPVESAAPGGKAQSGSQASRAEDPGGLECAELSAKHTKFQWGYVMYMYMYMYVSMHMYHVHVRVNVLANVHVHV